jgi:hypothetical protein
VERKNPEGMLGILKHNEVDILSLITLYTHLSNQLLKKDEDITARETLEVGRWFSVLGENNAAKDTLNSINELNIEEQLMAKFILAKQFKKEKKEKDAILMWEAIINHYTENTNEAIVIDSYIELAKIAEHKEKNIRLALEYGNKAWLLLNRKQKNIETNQKKQVDLLNRLKRLDRKNTRIRDKISLNHE